VIERVVRPAGPYSLHLTARRAGDATRQFRDGALTAVLPGGSVAGARQLPDGRLVLRGETEEALARLRFVLALDDDHTPFLRRFGSDPLLGAATRRLRGLRQLRVATVAQSLLRAFCGQLIESSRARSLERRIIRATSPEHPGTGLHAPPAAGDLGRLSAAALRAHGLHARRSAALLRLCEGVDLERLRELPTAAVVARLARERGLGPWSAGVVCLEGLGRTDHGLVGDLGLVKLLRALRGRPVEAWETAELLDPYGEWAGLASVYLLAAYGAGLLPVEPRRAAA
jgi:3-methyladenine DNA glycosylase/8-oxoguanine DNA glycosylase